MTREQHLRKIERRFWNPKKCDECGGTGKIGPKRGCAKCVVRSVVPSVPDREVRWLIKTVRGLAR